MGDAEPMMHSSNIMSRSVIIVGASARAAAFSALAGGLTPICADQFGDADLSLRCVVTPIRDYPAGFAQFVQCAPGEAWIYTGALENYPALVTRIVSQKSLWGNDAQRWPWRDPVAVQRTLRTAGFAAPEVRDTADSLPHDGSWLRKSRRSSGGHGVELWGEANSGDQKSPADQYFQRFVAGTSCAAIYLAAPDGQSRLLGATEQLLMPASGNGPAFRYAGSAGPLRLDDRRSQLLADIGQILTNGLGLVGLYGIDYIDDGRDIWPVEVNPRYTASIEILERSLSFSAVGWHVAACRDGVVCRDQLMPDDMWHAKRILYATEDLLVDRSFVESVLSENAQRRVPVVADIPVIGTPIKQGRPVMTIFAEGRSRDDALLALERAADDWRRRLFGGSTAER